MRGAEETFNEDREGSCAFWARSESSLYEIMPMREQQGMTFTLPHEGRGRLGMSPKNQEFFFSVLDRRGSENPSICMIMVEL